MRAAARATYNAALAAELVWHRPKRDRTPILLLGTGRGGTTLLMDALAQGFSAVPIFEPMAPHATWQNRLRLPDHGYVRLGPDDQHSHLRRIFKQALAGRLWNRWTLGHSTVRDARQSKRVVVKEVRANRMVGWLQTSFPEAHLVVLIRNPVSVVDSMMRAPHGWSRMSWSQVVPPAAQALGLSVGDLPGPRASKALWLASLWIADTRLALLESGPTTSVIAFEDCLAHPHRILGTFADFGDLRLDLAVSRLQVPSRTASAGRRRSTVLNDVQKRGVLGLCRDFGVNSTAPAPTPSVH